MDHDSTKSHYVTCSDASASGCGVHMLLNGGNICHKHWTNEESQYSSTWQEPSAIEYALEYEWIRRKCFDLEEEAWGPHTIDCFENYELQIPRFFSWHWNPSCSGVDFSFKI